MRAAIEQRMGIDAVDIYGLSEVMGPGVANECVETKDGPTIWEDHFYPEIIDPETGQPLPDGELGELVFTSLTKEALPIIRYRTRDLTRLLPGTARTMRRMEKITGRSDDMMIVRGVNVFPTQIEELICKRVRAGAALPVHPDARGPARLPDGGGRGAARGCRTRAMRRGAAAELLAHEIKTYIGTTRQDRAARRRRHRAQHGQGQAGAGPARQVAERATDVGTEHVRSSCHRGTGFAGPLVAPSGGGGRRPLRGAISGRCPRPAGRPRLRRPWTRAPAPAGTAGWARTTSPGDVAARVGHAAAA